MAEGVRHQAGMAGAIHGQTAGFGDSLKPLVKRADREIGETPPLSLLFYGLGLVLMSLMSASFG